MQRRVRLFVGFFTLQFVVVAALVHIMLGALEWMRWMEAGFLLPRDARWPVFVVSGFAILAGTHLATEADNRKPFYLAGIVVMLGYVLGYFGWHLGGHRLLLIVGEGPGTAESLSVEWFLDHLFAGPVEFGAILVETLAAAGLAVMYLTEDDATDGQDSAGDATD